MKSYLAPNGQPIIGILESLPCMAGIDGLDENGNPVYVGQNEIDWDEQKPVIRDGGFVFVDMLGNEWTFSQLNERTT